MALVQMATEASVVLATRATMKRGLSWCETWSVKILTNARMVLYTIAIQTLFVQTQLVHGSVRARLDTRVLVSTVST